MNRSMLILSPPFYSHFNPLLELARSLKRKGFQVTMACGLEFEKEILEHGLQFVELNLSRNRNTGVAGTTVQEESEKKRLEEFFQATRRGPVETLLTQLGHRKADTLGDPETLLAAIRETHHRLKPEFWILDQLSYGATLCLHCLQVPYLTFCPPHPDSIPAPGALYNIPKGWCPELSIDPSLIPALEHMSLRTEMEFTRLFNDFVEKHAPSAPRVSNAFGLVSPWATLFLYPDFYGREDHGSMPRRIYLGSCFREEPLPHAWQESMEQAGRCDRRILLSFGTFLSERWEVLEQLVQGCLSYDPEAFLVVAAGNRAGELAHLASDRVLIREFVPQKALLPSMDLVIHHGGCNTFTETLYYGKPMMILPFSSDQFNIAWDARRLGLAVILDPNRLEQQAILHALDQCFHGLDREAAVSWSKVLQEQGADYAASLLSVQ